MQFQYFLVYLLNFFDLVEIKVVNLGLVEIEVVIGALLRSHVKILLDLIDI